VTGDPLWLPGTAAVCSSTLVAIVGGLLVSRIVAGDQDAAALQREIDRLKDAVATEREALDAAEATLRQAEARQWVARVLPTMAGTITATHRDPDVEHLLSHNPVGLRKEDLEGEYKRVCELLGAALANIETELQQRALAELLATWENAREQYQIGKPDPFDDRVVHEMYWQVYKLKAVAAAQRGEPWAVPEMPKPPDAVPAALSAFRPLNELKAEQTRLAPVVAALQAQIDTARKVKLSPSNRDLRATYLCLGGAALVGVLFPLGILAWNPGKLVLGLRCLLAASVCGTVLLVYFALRSRPGTVTAAGRTGP
jgi:hypothetical protein